MKNASYTLTETVPTAASRLLNASSVLAMLWKSAVSGSPAASRSTIHVRARAEGAIPACSAAFSKLTYSDSVRRSEYTLDFGFLW